MPDNASLHIHAHILPCEGAQKQQESPEPTEPVDAAGTADARNRRPRVRSRRVQRASRGDRLLRNSAIACAILLGVLALGNVDAPWAKKAHDGIERALTMRIDLDESIGALQFVKGLMPESALVFMNIGGDSGRVRPVDGAVSHSWSNLQPWMMFKCDENAKVCAIGSGTVTAVSSLTDGRIGLLVDHGEGIESLYAGLTQPDVSAGDAVERSQSLGSADDSVYFEYRVNGESVDPSQVLGL